MTTPVHDFLVKTLEAMNFPTDGLTDATPLGENGLELESLSVAELVMQLEEEYGIGFPDEEVEAMPGATFGQLRAGVEARVAALAGGGAGEPAP